MLEFVSGIFVGIVLTLAALYGGYRLLLAAAEEMNAGKMLDFGVDPRTSGATRSGGGAE